MTTYSEYGPVTPIRRVTSPLSKTPTGLDTPAPKPPYPEPVTPVPKPPYTGPVKPPYPEPVTPVPKPPYTGPVTPIPPANPSPTVPNPPKPPYPGPGTTGTGTGAPPTPGHLGLDFMRQVTPNELVANQLQGLLDSNSPYVQNARRRGAEQANSRGMLNSSISAGASERAALEAAAPIAVADAEVYRQANQGNFESLNQLRQMRTAAELDDWLGSQTYNREFNGRLAMMPIQSSMDMLTYIQQRALEDPSVYTPEVMSGIGNFFNQNMFDIMGRYFNLSGPGGT